MYPLRRPIDTYHGLSSQDFVRYVAEKDIAVQAEVTGTLLPPNGIYVSPETKNKYYQYSNGIAEGFHYEQYITSYCQDLAITAEYFVAVFVIELPQPTVPLYISSRTSFSFNTVVGLQSLPVLKGLQKVQLEGEFSEFFTVYSRDDHALDAFTTIVPNLMVDMLAKGNAYDIEFAGRYVYFYRLCSSISYTGEGENLKVAVPFSADEYVAMREFGLKYGERFIRAARPSTGDTATDVQPLWQLANANQAANNREQRKSLLWIAAYLMLSLFLWYAVIPLTLLFVSVRYLQWRARKKRLIERWADKV